MRVFASTALILALLLLPAQQSFAQTTVNVGAYNYPPFISHAESDNPKGLLIELLDLLNGQQAEFRFVLVPTSIARRYQDLNSGRFDLMLFESEQWGWQGRTYQAIDMAIEDAGLYVAKAQPGRDQHYFDSFTDKRMALYSGFRYGFSGFNADRDTLRQNYQAEFTYSHESNLLKVLAGRSDITVVSQPFLDGFIAENPASAEQFLVSEKTDQVFQFQVLLRSGSPISAEQMSKLYNQLRSNGKLAALLVKYHMHLTD